MYVKYVCKCSDCDDPVIDIHPSSAEEAFELGRIFERIVASNHEAWHDGTGIRIPLHKTPQDDIE